MRAVILSEVLCASWKVWSWDYPDCWSCTEMWTRNPFERWPFAFPFLVIKYSREQKVTHFVLDLSSQAEEGEYSEGPGGTQWMQMINGAAALSILYYFYHHPVESIYVYELKHIAQNNGWHRQLYRTDTHSSTSLCPSAHQVFHRNLQKEEMPCLAAPSHGLGFSSLHHN